MTRRRPGWSLAAGVYAALVVCALLYPFAFFPRNGVEWLEDRPGLYFNGAGIAHGAFELDPGVAHPPEALTVELWLRERKTSRNWGARSILSIDVAAFYPPITLGQWSGRLFFFDPRAAEPDPWYEQFLVGRKLARDRDHFVAVVLAGEHRTIYVDSELVGIREAEEEDARRLDLSGPIILGNTADAERGWWGELHGLAVYGRAVDAGELQGHRDRVRRHGLGSLRSAEGLLALVPFDEGEGDTARNLVPGGAPIHIPGRLVSRPGVLFSWVRLRHGFLRPRLGDVTQNVVFFVPLGCLLALASRRRRQSPRAALWAKASATGTILSLALELAQLSLPARSADPTDVACNGLGTALGVTLILWWPGASRRGGATSGPGKRRDTPS